MTKKPSLTVRHDDFAELRELVREHDKLLIRGNGDPSIQERMRNIEKFVASLQYWSRTIAIMFIAQFVVVIVGAIMMFVRVYPSLLELDKMAAR